MRDLLIRVPNHLGDLVMALPALEAAGGDVLVVRWLAPLLELLPGYGPAGSDRPRWILPMDRGTRNLAASVRAVRRHGYRRGVLLPPSFSSALLFVLAGVRERRGAATEVRRPLLTDAVPAAALAGLHRSAGYMVLATGERPVQRRVARLDVPAAARDRWLALAGAADGPVIGVFPGSNATSRRWDADRYAELVRRLADRGARVVVFGGARERDLAAEVAGAAALDVAGRTDLVILAAGLAECDLLVTNDSGPMHLAAAVGTATISLQGASDPRVTGPLGAGHVYVRRSDLPCVPCVKNRCPRRGRGTVLPEAERECLRLIGVADVLAAVEGHPRIASLERS